MIHSEKITFRRGSEGRNLAPVYEIVVSEKGMVTWNGKENVNVKGLREFQLSLEALADINTMAAAFSKNKFRPKYIKQETNLAFSELQIRFADQPTLAIYENIGTYLESGGEEKIPQWIEEDIHQQMIPASERDELIHILLFEYRLEKLLNVHELVK